jgi:hypothetical protein
MPAPAATCVWRLRPPVLAALHERFGAPADTYGNGSQTGLRSDGPDGTPIEWRLHPRSDFVRPTDLAADQVFTRIAGGEDDRFEPDRVWTGLEAAWAFGDDLPPQELAGCASRALGVEPDACGTVDRDALQAQWERSGGRLDVIDHLLTALEQRSPG